MRNIVIVFVLVAASGGMLWTAYKRNQMSQFVCEAQTSLAELPPDNCAEMDLELKKIPKLKRKGEFLSPQCIEIEMRLLSQI